MISNNFKKYFFIFLSYNICLIPFLLVTGPFLPDLSLSICSLSYIVYIIIKKEFSIFKNIFFIFFLIFYFIIVLSSFLSENILFSLHSSLPYIRFGLFIMCVWHTAKEDKNLFNKIFIVITVVFALLIFDGYLQFFTGTNILNYEKIGVRVSSFFGDELILGSYVVRFFPIYLGLYYLIIRKRKTFLYEKLFFLIFFVAISILIFISGERTAFGLLIMTILLLIFFLHVSKKLKFVILISFISIFVILLNIYQNNFTRLIIETKDQIINADNLTFFGPLRHEYAIVSINIFKENIILGSGPRTYRINSKDEKYKISDLSWNTHPHSIYFQLLAETGIAGTIMIFFTFGYFVITLFREQYNKSNNPSFANFKICIVIAIIINIFPFIPSGNFFNNWMSIVIYYPVAIFVASSLKLKY